MAPRPLQIRDNPSVSMVLGMGLAWWFARVWREPLNWGIVALELKRVWVFFGILVEMAEKFPAFFSAWARNAAVSFYGQFGLYNRGNVLSGALQFCLANVSALEFLFAISHFNFNFNFAIKIPFLLELLFTISHFNSNFAIKIPSKTLVTRHIFYENTKLSLAFTKKIASFSFSFNLQPFFLHSLILNVFITLHLKWVNIN